MKPIQLQGEGKTLNAFGSSEKIVSSEDKNRFQNTLVIILDTKGRILRVNQACMKLLGYSGEEILGKPIWNALLFRENASQFKIAFRSVLLQSHPIKLALSIRTKENHILSISSCLSKKYDSIYREEYVMFAGNIEGESSGSNGKFQICCSTSPLLSKVIHRRSEMLSDANEDQSSHVSNINIQPQFLAYLLDTLNECVLVLDLNGKIVYWNQGAQRVFGYSEVEIRGKTPHILCSEENRQRFWDYLKEVNQQGVYNVVCEGLRKDKTKVWLEISLSHLINTDGVSNGYVLIAHDMTDRQETIEALSESEERFKTLFESIPDAILLTDAESGIILDANPATAKLFEKPVDQIIGLSHSDLYPEESWEKIKILFAELPVRTSGAEEEFFETEILRADNVRILVEIHSRMISYRGRQLILGTLRDLTQRKIAEKAMLTSSRLEATATLAGGLAHDINNLMATVMGNAELLKMDLALSTESEPLMDAILKSAEHAGKLAHEMLAFARQGKYQTNQINLNHVVTESLLILSHLKPPRIHIKKELAEDLSAIIADSSQINQAIINVYNNAIEALQGEGELIIRTSNVELKNTDLHDVSDIQPGSYVLLSISDNGCGMSDETRQLAFEPFFSTKFTGRGMGLAAVYGIVKNHNGYITLDSAIEVGTTVSMYFPAMQKISPSPEKPKDTLVGGTETILVVDDDETILAITKLQLEHLGYTVLTAKNGKIALDLAQAYDSEIHLTLLDLKMPVMDGPATFDPLKKLRPKIKFVIYSGFELDQEAQSLLDRGAYAFLSKPTQFSTLAMTVRNALDENEIL